MKCTTKSGESQISLTMIIIALLRLIHIFFGIVWAGTNFMMVLFILPSAEQMDNMTLLQRKMEIAARTTAVLIALSVISMPIAKFLIQ